MSTLTDWLIAGSTALAAAAAGGSWRAAGRANKTAETLARIEADRRTLERTPQLDVRFSGDGEDRADLYVFLNGPDELRELDSVSVAVQDDDRDLGLASHQQHVGGPTEDELRRFVWGPFRFVPGVDGADRDGRAPASFPLVVGKGRPLVMERTRPGRWMGSMTMEQWQDQNARTPIRLRITCRLGDEEWLITKQFPNRGFVHEVAVG